MIKFTDNGYQVYKPMVDEPLEDDEWENFQGRVPFIYSQPNRAIYMGAPNWYHNDVEDSHGIDSGDPDMYQGYIGSNDKWGKGVRFYNTSPPEKDELAKAIQQAGYDINPEAQAPNWKDVDQDDLWDDD